MPDAFICEYVELPEFKFASTSDQTGAIPGLVCHRIEEPLPGGSLTSWIRWNKIARIIEGLP